VRTAAARLEQSVTGLESSHTEIGDLDVLLSIEEQILRLEIAVADVEAVTVVHASYDLLKVSRCLVGWQSALRHQVIEQFSTLDKLEHKVASFSIIPDLSSEANSSLAVSHTSYSDMTFGWSISFMMTISRSIPKTALSCLAPASVMDMRDEKRRACLGTILIAAYCPVLECLAILTRPGHERHRAALTYR
jgi:hypothetical protein